ncbi:MAG: UDP-N-acetylmuramate--L-alanine ligase [Bacteroidetes bacterium]|nr:UDP-N-acetylmuramate--L-alanine ligase [Bacteroidota bacterium]
MRTEHLHRVYFIGIGGIGMSAIARFFNERGIYVSGYDKTSTPLTEQLVKEGIVVHFDESINALDKEANLVVYTPAIPAQHLQLHWYRENGFEVVKRSDVLQSISESMQAVCVAGTHGKTTISTLIAHILRHTGYGCNAFLGGISANYGVNYWSSEKSHAVIEADEYDRSFLKLFPSIAVVTAMDADHLDIYGTLEEMERCYLQFITQVKDTLVYKHGLKESRNFNAPKKVSYSIQNDAATFYASEIRMHDGAYTFLAHKKDECLGEVNLFMGGMHNVENTMAAIAVCNLLNIDFEKVKLAIADFKGVKRRFEYVVKNQQVVCIDDYAHHPEELRMLIMSAKSLFAGKKVSVLFQPHLFTRTRDFADGFAESLDLADEVVLLAIYPARELPIDGISSELILSKMSLNNKHILSKEGALQWVSASKHEVLIIAGAGDIDAMVEPIKQILENKS